MRVTQKMIAAQAGVAQTTVSYVLTNSPQSALISEEVRERIARIARELGYRPNRNARKLATGRTRTVGVILNQMSGAGFHVWNVMAMGAEAEILSASYQVLLSFPDPDLSLIEHSEALVKEGSVDGVVIFASSDQSLEFDQICDSGIPIAMVSFIPDKTHVRHDSSVGLREALDHLHKHGHESVLWGAPTLGEPDGSKGRAQVVRDYGVSLGMRVE